MANPLFLGTTDTAWTTTTNWNPAAIPVSGDSVYLKNCAVSILSGFAQSAVLPALLQIDSTYSGVIGGTSANVNTPGSNFLAIGPVLTIIGEPSTSGTAGTGSGRIKLDYGSSPNTTIIRSTRGSSSDVGMAPVRLKGTNTANALYVQSGRLDCAMEDPDDVYKCATFSVTGSDAVLSMSPACVWVTGYQTAGVVNLNSGGTTLTQQAGTLSLKGSDVVRTLTVGGTTTIDARPTAMSVSGITRSSTTATATVSSTATLATGDTVLVRGANQAGYNGFKVITVASGTTFTFTTASDDVTPATGTMTALKAIATLIGGPKGVAHFKGDSREIAVATLAYNPGFKWTFNQANPSHLIIGTLTPLNAGQLTAA